MSFDFEDQPTFFAFDESPYSRSYHGASTTVWWNHIARFRKKRQCSKCKIWITFIVFTTLITLRCINVAGISARYKHNLDNHVTLEILLDAGGKVSALLKFWNHLSLFFRESTCHALFSKCDFNASNLRRFFTAISYRLVVILKILRTTTSELYNT